MTTLSVYHQRRIAAARRHTAELHDLSFTDMSLGDMAKWLTRMETATRDLLNVLTLLELAGDLKEARDER